MNQTDWLDEILQKLATEANLLGIKQIAENYSPTKNEFMSQQIEAKSLILAKLTQVELEGRIALLEGLLDKSKEYQENYFNGRGVGSRLPEGVPTPIIEAELKALKEQPHD